MKTLALSLFLVALCAPTLLLAEEVDPPPAEEEATDEASMAAPLPYLNLGFAPVLAPGDDGRPTVPLAYILLDVMGMALIDQRFTLLFGGGVDVAPVAGNWGVYGYLTAEFNITSWLAFDIGGLLMSDWDPLLMESRGQPMTGYAGPASAFAFFLPKGIGLTFGASFLVNLEGLGWALAPTVAVSLPLPHGPTATGG